MDPTTHYAQQYASTIELLLQQKDSRWSGKVSPMSVTGAKSAVPVDQIGVTEATKRTTRFPPLNPVGVPTDRPWVYPSDFDWNDLLDSIDRLRTLSDPKGSLALSGQYAMNRAKDREIRDAWFADRKTGQEGGTTTTFLAANSIIQSFGATGNVGLTVAKLREAKRILMAAEVDVEADPLTVAVKAKQHDNLLAEIQVISLDFNERPVMVDGMVRQFLGFNLKHTELISASAGNDLVPAYAKSGMHLAIWNDITTDVSQRKDLAGLPYQVYVYGTFGAVRSEGVKVVQITCA